MTRILISVWAIGFATSLLFSCKKSNSSGNTATGPDSLIYTGLTQMKSTGIFDQAGAAAGSKMVFAGGSESTATPSYSAEANIYDINTGQWTSGQLSQPRFYLSAAAAGSKIAFGGGTPSGGNSSKRVDIYDVNTGVWTIDSLTAPTYQNAAAGAGNKIVFAGGQTLTNDVYSEIDNVDIYDVSQNTWSTAHLVQARRALAGASAGNTIAFAGGGDNNNNPSSAVDIYNVSTGKWTSSFLPVAEYSLMGAGAGNKLVFVGGDITIGTNSFSLAQIYDIPSGQWTIDTVHRHSVQLSNAAVSGDLLLFAEGAESVTGNEILDIYNTTTGKWSTSSLPDVRVGMSAVGLGGIVLFEGGYSNNTVFSTADLFKSTLTQ